MREAHPPSRRRKRRSVNKLFSHITESSRLCGVWLSMFENKKIPMGVGIGKLEAAFVSIGRSWI